MLLGYSFVVSVSMRYLFGSVGVMVQALLVALPTALSSPGVTLSNLVDSGATTKRAGKVGGAVAASAWVAMANRACLVRCTDCDRHASGAGSVHDGAADGAARSRGGRGRRYSVPGEVVCASAKPGVGGTHSYSVLLTACRRSSPSADSARWPSPCPGCFGAPLWSRFFRLTHTRTSWFSGWLLCACAWRW